MNAQGEHNQVLTEHLVDAIYKELKIGRCKLAKESKVPTFPIAFKMNSQLKLIAEYLEDQVLERIKRGLLFSLLADECRGSCGKQMLSLFFRYVWFDEESTKYSAHEDFVVFLRCQKVSGGELFNILIEYLLYINKMC